jgi:hypothetical protein
MSNAKRFYSLFLLLAALVPAATISATAHAQSAASTRIDKFSVESDNKLATGAQLTFAIEGAPRGHASVRISGVDRNIPLKEMSSGVYRGDYTIKRADKITSASTARATLRIGNGTAGMTYKLSPATIAAAGPKIDRFTVTPIGKIEPGANLKFNMAGTPGAKAAFTIEGVARNIAMAEVTRGNYEGSYTIRRLDHFPSAAYIYGTLEADGRATGAGLNQALIVDATPPAVRNTSPRDGETVAAGTPTPISATFDDSGGVGIDAGSVKVTIGGRDVTKRAKVTPQFFSYSETLKPGRHTVEVTARDLASNAVRYAWTFAVAPRAPATLPLQVLSHANNAQVPGGTIDIRGRTAPDALVDVHVLGHSSVAGFFGVNQQVHDQSLRADPSGNFAFSFTPQIAFPGTRYEITMNASKADLKTESHLVLFQQQ